MTATCIAYIKKYKSSSPYLIEPKNYVKQEKTLSSVVPKLEYPSQITEFPYKNLILIHTKFRKDISRQIQNISIQGLKEEYDR